MNKLMASFNAEYLRTGSERKGLYKMSIENMTIDQFKFRNSNPTVVVSICNLPPLKVPIVHVVRNSSCRVKWKTYRKLVWSITNTQDLKSLDHYDKRSFRGYHLDHKISIWDGFKKDMDPYVVGNLSNLRMIPYLDNMRKGIKSIYD